MKLKGINFVKFIFSMIIIIALLFPFDSVGIVFPKYLINGIYVNIKFLIVAFFFIVALVCYFICEGQLKKEKSKFHIIMNGVISRILIDITLIVLCSLGFVHPIVACIIVMCDLFSLGFNNFITTEKDVLPIVRLGVYRDSFLMVGIIVTLFYNLPFEIWAINVSGYLLFVGTILSMASCIQYFNLVKKYMK